MKPLAIIPARAGSKRLPDKNRQQVGPYTLVELAILNAAAACGARVVVSTDYGVGLVSERFRLSDIDWEQLYRPPELCADDTPMMDVVRHAVDQPRHMDWDSVVLLQPTSPLRTVEDVQGVLALLEGGAEAAMSVVAEPAPELFKMGHANRLRPFHFDAFRGQLVRPNGAVYAIRRDVLDAGFDWWTASVVEGYVMPPERSVDIDTIVDLEEARTLWNQQQL